MTTRDFAVTLLVEGLDDLHFPIDPWPYGSYELSRQPDPFVAVEHLLQREISALGGFSPTVLRLKTFVVNVADSVEAVKSARIHAGEILSLLRAEFPLAATGSLADIGCVMDLRTGEVGRLPTKHPMQRTYPLFLIDEREHHPNGTLKLLLAAHPHYFGELGKAIRRSAHWRFVAGSLEERSQHLLMTWMAFEVLCRTSDEAMTPRILSAVGLLSDRHAQLLLPADRIRLRPERGRVRAWKRRLFALIERTRRTRNAIVHNGFREIEILDVFTEPEYALLTKFLSMALPRLHGLALNALALRITSVAEMWARLGECLYFGRELVTTDLLGNVLHMLEQDYRF